MRAVGTSHGSARGPVTGFFFVMIPPPPRAPLFPYTTLFRSPGRPSASGKTSDRPCPASPRRGRRRQAFGSRSSARPPWRSEEHTSELQSLTNLVCRLLLEKNNKKESTFQDRTYLYNRTYVLD